MLSSFVLVSRGSVVSNVSFVSIVIIESVVRSASIELYIG